MAKSYRPEFLVGGEWYGNAQRFATPAEAEQSAQARFLVWTMPSDWRVSPSDDDVNYERVDGVDRRIEAQPAPSTAPVAPSKARWHVQLQTDGGRWIGHYTTETRRRAREERAKLRDANPKLKTRIQKEV